MARNLVFFWAICSLLLGLSSASDWNILSLKNAKSGVEITFKNYCESWRMNVELNNIKNFDVVPDECVATISKYMSSAQYKADSERTIDECRVHLSSCCNLKKDSTDIWIFDIDETLLSTVPYFKKNNCWGKRLNSTDLEEWMRMGKATALEHSLTFFNELKGKGVQIFLVSSRRECLRSETVDNLVNAGYHGWTSLILRGAEYDNKDVQTYKADVRKQLIRSGYRILGILGAQWSSIQGLPTAHRTFKLPNPLYYVA